MFKLVRIDTDETSEIQLPSGTYLIGRDKLIGFDDKRLSYNQGLIIVKEDSVTIESSQRKIYLTKKGSKQKEILNKTFKTVLEFGDQFGFLENCYWYELQSDEPVDRPLKDINVNISENLHFTKESVVPKSPLDGEKPRKRKNGEYGKENLKSKRRKKLLSSEEEVSDEQSSQEFESDELNVSEEENSKTTNSKRVRCNYGADCYSLRALRPNPAHKAHTAKYAHPRDEDWGDGGVKKCPQGAACRRRDPRHARKFKHPPGYRISQPDSSESDSDSSQEYRSDLVLRTKRERKPPPKEDLDLDLEGTESEEEDPFASDGSEDWMPEP